MRQELKFFMWLSVLKLDLYSKYKKDTYSKGEIQRYSRMALGGLSIRWISRPASPCWPLNPNMTWATFWFSLRRCAGLMEKIYGREGCCPEPLSHQVSWVVSFVHYNPSFVADSVGLMHWHVFRANDQQNFVFQDYREQGQSTRKVIWVGLEWHIQRTSRPGSHALTSEWPKRLRADCQSV